MTLTIVLSVLSVSCAVHSIWTIKSSTLDSTSLAHAVETVSSHAIAFRYVLRLD